MIPSLDIKHDLDKVSAEYGLMAEEQSKAAVRALNRTMVTARAESARGMQDEYPGHQDRHAQGAHQDRARPAGLEPRAALVFSPGRIQLYGNFGMRALGRWGVRFSRLPWRLETVSGEPVTPEMLARAFRQRSRSGGRAYVFARHTPARQSFEVLLAPGVARAFAERKVGDELATRALDIFVELRARGALSGLEEGLNHGCRQARIPARAHGRRQGLGRHQVRSRARSTSCARRSTR
jgi:hypothetical protein